MGKKEESYTRIQESGAFIRTYVRRGKKRHVKTKRIRKNNKKVVLGSIGDLEIYVYPFDYPDLVFIGKFPVSTTVTRGNVNEVIAGYNKIKWYLSGEWQNGFKNGKGANSSRRAIITAYDLGWKQYKKDRSSPVSP